VRRFVREERPLPLPVVAARGLRLVAAARRPEALVPETPSRGCEVLGRRAAIEGLGGEGVL